MYRAHARVFAEPIKLARRSFLSENGSDKVNCNTKLRWTQSSIPSCKRLRRFSLVQRIVLAKRPLIPDSLRLGGGK